MRRAARVDGNHGEIVSTFRRLGATVEDASRMGQGFPDLVVGWRGRNLLVEVKDGTKKPSARRLTEHEDRWHRRWHGEVAIVETVDDVIRLLGLAPGPGRRSEADP